MLQAILGSSVVQLQVVNQFRKCIPFFLFLFIYDSTSIGSQRQTHEYFRDILHSTFSTQPYFKLPYKHKIFLNARIWNSQCSVFYCMIGCSEKYYKSELSSLPSNILWYKLMRTDIALLFFLRQENHPGSSENLRWQWRVATNSGARKGVKIGTEKRKTKGGPRHSATITKLVKRKPRLKQTRRQKAKIHGTASRKRGNVKEK